MKIFVIWCILQLFGFGMYAQISDTSSTNISGFADFLFMQKEYSFAAEEYEKLYFYNPSNLYIFEKWLVSSRLSKKGSILERVHINQHTPTPILNEYFKSAITFNRFDLAGEVIDLQSSKTFPSVHLTSMLEGLFLLQNGYNEKKEITDPILKEYLGKYQNTHKKSPFMAGLFSAIVPGSGRVYTNDYANGIISLLFVAGTAYQSYVRFNKNGIRSYGGWIYGGISAGFYIGNIYGSAMSAGYYNKMKKREIDEMVKTRILGL